MTGMAYLVPVVCPGGLLHRNCRPVVCRVATRRLSLNNKVIRLCFGTSTKSEGGSVMAEEAIDHRTLARLVESGAVRAAHVISQAGGWGVIVTCGKIARPLAAQRGNVRLFSKLETVAVYLREIGISRFDVDVVDYDPERTRRARPDRSEALKRAHEAAAYDKWFRGQVQAALDDPQPSIPNEEVSARWAKKRARLAKKAKGAHGAKV